MAALPETSGPQIDTRLDPCRHTPATDSRVHTEATCLHPEGSGFAFSHTSGRKSAPSSPFAVHPRLPPPSFSPILPHPPSLLGLHPSSRDIPVAMDENERRVREMFDSCDRERKGFITRMDFQKLRQDMDLEPGAWEDVFTSLDADEDGCLTYAEFRRGFRAFLSIN
ncbi:unnamed protein product [Darwinula stevensoni]|uniref:EF-hand domain-containing protein n=1 Tax=Darwinula stevensoni TaxID=69355 RepID=A0A7R9FN19_9CRUS|nr:unnamed protein product [Darwinula stevensoni]CAG0896171.1 unnamed protein product [Darwinula stevensoni]